MKDKQRAELLEILKVLLEEDLTWFELRTPSGYIRIGSPPEGAAHPALNPAADGRATAGFQPPAPSRRAPSPVAPASGAASPAHAPSAGSAIPSGAPAAGEQVAPAATGEHVVTAPFAGVFYRRPSPAEPPFVEIGSRVRATDTVCLVEVMKLFNSVQAGVDGVVSGIQVANGDVVEYGQPLMRITPDDQIS